MKIRFVFQLIKIIENLFLEMIILFQRRIQMLSTITEFNSKRYSCKLTFNDNVYIRHKMPGPKMGLQK